jgi:hypothetical protein
MTRHFGWLRQQHPEAHFTFRPWTGNRLPEWVEDAIRRFSPGFDLDAAYTTIAALLDGPNVDDLGSFIESNPDNAMPGAGVHVRVHRALAKWESENGGDQTGLMADLGRAPLDEFFWNFHSWIDDLYAEWQIKHGESADRSPRPMKHMHTGCEEIPLPPSHVH